MGKEATAPVTGLVATSPTKGQPSGALNLILQRAKERRAAAKQPMTISESTADLVLNMEETATENQPVDEKVYRRVANSSQFSNDNPLCILIVKKTWLFIPTYADGSAG